MASLMATAPRHVGHPRSCHYPTRLVAPVYSAALCGSSVPHSLRSRRSNARACSVVLSVSSNRAVSGGGSGIGRHSRLAAPPMFKRALLEGGRRTVHVRPEMGMQRHEDKARDTSAHFQPMFSDARMRKRVDELTVRKMYLTNYWYAVGFTKNVKQGSIQRIKILDMYVCLWRDTQGCVHCVTDTCPVTGGTLSDGTTSTTHADGTHEVIRSKDGEVSFLAHNGELVQAPEETIALGAMPSDPHLEVWNCQEKGGFIWLFFGDYTTPDHERPPIPSVPELEKSGWTGVHGEVTMRGNHWMVTENVIDMSHVPYVHKGTVGDHAAFTDIEIKEMPYALNFAFPIDGHSEEGKASNFHVDAKATACLPSTTFIRFSLPVTLKPFGVDVMKNVFRMVTINSVVPVDEFTTTIRFCQMRNFVLNGILDPIIKKGMENILGEDRVIIEMLRPEEVTVEVSIKADAPQAAFRKMREQCIHSGNAVLPGPRALHLVQAHSQAHSSTPVDTTYGIASHPLNDL